MHTLLRPLLAALFCCLFLLPAGAQDGGDTKLNACECLECMKLLQLSAKAEGEAYVKRWPTAHANLQAEVRRYESDPAYRARMEAEGRVLFCELWSTLRDELDVVRDIELPKLQKQILANDMHCALQHGGSVDPASCELDETLALLSEMTAPCPQMALAVLAHELVHVSDCLARKQQSDNSWLDTPGKSCNEAFKGKAAPSPNALLAFAEAAFWTEAHAHDTEEKVNKLLQNELTLQCRPKDYSTRMATNPRYDEARAFLERARTYGRTEAE